MYSIFPLIQFVVMLDQLFTQGRIWQRHRSAQGQAIDTGFALLNHYLPGGGWPRDGVTEIIYPRPGIGELSLLLPCLREISLREISLREVSLRHLNQQQSPQKQWMVWVAPPWQPNAAALTMAGVDIRELLLVQTQSDAFKHDRSSHNREVLWALEECLKSGAVSVVLGWPQHINPTQARRLQMCAGQYQVPCFLFKHQSTTQASQPTPCALRLRLTPVSTDTLEIDILKQRQGWSPPPFHLTLKRYSPFCYRNACYQDFFYQDFSHQHRGGL